MAISPAMAPMKAENVSSPRMNSKPGPVQFLDPDPEVLSPAANVIGWLTFRNDQPQSSPLSKYQASTKSAVMKSSVTVPVYGGLPFPVVIHTN